VSRAFRERESAPAAPSEECASCEAMGATDGLCHGCREMIRIAGNHTVGCRCGVCTLAAAAQWALRDARGAA
jgi:hypothetical protein